MPLLSVCPVSLQPNETEMLLKESQSHPRHIPDAPPAIVTKMLSQKNIEPIPFLLNPMARKVEIDLSFSITSIDKDEMMLKDAMTRMKSRRNVIHFSIVIMRKFISRCCILSLTVNASPVSREIFRQSCQVCFRID